MKVVVFNYHSIYAPRDETNYTRSGKIFEHPRWKAFDSRFVAPMRANLRSSLERFKALGAESILEIGPGGGSGSDIALSQGIRKIDLVEVNPTTVAYLEEKYANIRDAGSMVLHNGDVRDVLPHIPDKSKDICLIFDNTLSNMQEPTAALDGVGYDFRVPVLKELLRIARKAVLVGVSDVAISDIFLEVFRDKVSFTTPDKKTSICSDGMVTKRYSRKDFERLLSETGFPLDYTICRDKDIYWCEVRELTETKIKSRKSQIAFKIAIGLTLSGMVSFCSGHSPPPELATLRESVSPIENVGGRSFDAAQEIEIHD
jgi:SAM-dependent methyltransferase